MEPAGTEGLQHTQATHAGGFGRLSLECVGVCSQFWRHFIGGLVSTTNLRRYHGRTCAEFRRPYLPQDIRTSRPSDIAALLLSEAPCFRQMFLQILHALPVCRPPHSSPRGTHRRQQGQLVLGCAPRLAGACARIWGLGSRPPCP